MKTGKLQDRSRLLQDAARLLQFLCVLGVLCGCLGCAAPVASPSPAPQTVQQAQGDATSQTDAHVEQAGIRSLEARLAAVAADVEARLTASAQLQARLDARMNASGGDQAAGPQNQQTGQGGVGIQIGTLRIDGLALAIVAAAAVAVVGWIVIRSGRRRRLNELLAGQLERLPAADRKAIRGPALSRGVEGELRRTLRRIRNPSVRTPVVAKSEIRNEVA
jgi:hypothetical protein